MYYKVLNADGSCCHGGTGSWHPPRGRRPGLWMPRVERVEVCASGYHVCRLENLFDWFGPAIWTVEVDGDLVDGGNKMVAARARLLTRTPWSDKIARLFAADCAERVLPLYERAAPGDSRPRDCIAVARRHARGEATDEELAAARAAARDAAWDAAWAAAGDAAWDAARDAAGAAAGAAAGDAAWDAAGDAAWDAARAAAGDAAGDAAWDAARDAERAWQTERLRQYLTGEAS